VQTQQSYAYGAKKAAVLPDMLMTRHKLSIDAMAGHIEEGIEEEPDEEEEYDQSEVISYRDDGEPSEIEDEKSGEEDKDNDSGEDVDEDEIGSQNTHPSAFPSYLPDQSYNWERGIRRTNVIQIQRPGPRGSSKLQRFSQSAKIKARRLMETISDYGRMAISTLHAVYYWAYLRMAQSLDQVSTFFAKTPMASAFKALTFLVAAGVATGMLWSTVCFFYSRVGCGMIPTTGFGQSIHSGFQTICGDCYTSTTSFDLTKGSGGDLTKISAALASINKKIHEVERRLTYRIDTNQATLESDLVSLKQQQQALSNHLADHIDQQAGPANGNVASPLMPKINFFAPSNGAVVDALRSSPTKEKQRSILMRTLRSLVGFNTHYANPPTTALKPWHDVGDNWCAASVRAGNDFIRLSVDTKEMIYATELVVEHFPSSGLLDRATTPRAIELWADFSHLSGNDWQQLQLGDMQEGNVLGPSFARLGRLKYDASGRANHIQSAMLDVNQYGLLHSAKTYVVRVTKNHGADNVCMYRIRLHGQPVAAPESGSVESWYENEGYQTGDE
jgi:hypothetical protein